MMTQIPAEPTWSDKSYETEKTRPDGLPD
jgi:hypothetical protein